MPSYWHAAENRSSSNDQQTTPVKNFPQEAKPDKLQYAEIVGEVKNKEDINQELDYDEKTSSDDQIILSNDKFLNKPTFFTYV